MTGMYWEQIINEVLNKNSVPHYFTPLGDDNEEPSKTAPRQAGRSQHRAHRRKKVVKTYPLGNAHPNTYFTAREADCMTCLLRGKTIKEVARSLELSPRTVEFYLKKMKAKLNCHSKSELIDKVLDSDFRG